MSQTTDFITNLYRAANEIGKLSIDERRRLVDRAVRTAGEMRIETGVRPGRGNNDALREIEIAALMAEARGSEDDVKAVLLDLAEMIRTLRIVLDGKTK
ncbi:hypothetical protein [Rhizobium giardinii]|uniref:hypothetical protein n=1 Tax=Rhizobium giardinii TaxID=56731 RepID=UPI000360E37D|nr:hypothetical protein [Rhizobium giardinii]